MDPRKLIGNRIKELRRKKGLSQEKLSEKAEITPNYLSRVERGTENPTLDMFIRLSEALDVEMWEMFDFGHNLTHRDLKTALNKLSQGAEEEKLRLAIKVLRAVIR
ncbi:MAG: helix-turn-helix transcriptional regulator [Nitrospirae bacterium]|nr:helix-turn-helix transcriptional regulator [Nitrospirota bacterium]